MKTAKSHKYVRGQTLKGYIAEQMKAPDFKKAWHDLDTEFELLESRAAHWIAQRVLAHGIYSAIGATSLDYSAPDGND